MIISGIKSSYFWVYKIMFNFLNPNFQLIPYYYANRQDIFESGVKNRVQDWAKASQSWKY